MLSPDRLACIGEGPVLCMPNGFPSVAFNFFACQAVAAPGTADCCGYPQWLPEFYAEPGWGGLFTASQGRASKRVRAFLRILRIVFRTQGHLDHV